MGAEVVVAALHVGDLPALGVLFEQHSGRPADLATFERWITTSPAAGAFHDDRLVGYTVTKRFAPDVVEVASMLVDPGHRGTHIGARLVAHVEEAARASGVEAVILVSSTAYETAAERPDPEPFYKRLGYRVLFQTSTSTVMGRTLGDDA